MRAIPAGSCGCPRLGGGGTATVIVALPLRPSLVAVIVAEPVVTPVTSPTALTVATAPALPLHVTVRPLSTLPLASFSTALSCSVCPAAPGDCPQAIADVVLGRLAGAVVPFREGQRYRGARRAYDREVAHRARKHGRQGHAQRRTTAPPVARRRDRRRPSPHARDQPARAHRRQS